MQGKNDVNVIESNEGKKPIRIDKGKKPVKIPKEKNKRGIRLRSINKWFYIGITLIAIVVLIIYIALNDTNIEEIKDSVVMLEVYDENNNLVSTGSGFCIFKSNLIATNYHVIEGAYKIKIICDDHSEAKVNNILIFNAESDLAILESSKTFKPLREGNTKKLKAGDRVVAIGSPEGQLNTVSTGVISNADNKEEIRITAPISPGSSGGVLLNSKNRIIGITNATYNSEKSQNLNYAINIELLKELYKQYQDGKYKVLSSDTINYAKRFKIKPEWGNQSYKPTSLKNFYTQTNTKIRFEKFLPSDWLLIYNNLSREQKDTVIAMIEILENYDYGNKNIREGINNWDTIQFFINLNILEKYQYAIVTTDLSNYSNKDNKFNQVNLYPLDAAQKTLILYIIGEYDWRNISESNKEDVFNYFDKKYNTEELGVILELLGYKVRYNKDGTLTAWW